MILFSTLFKFWGRLGWQLRLILILLLIIIFGGLSWYGYSSYQQHQIQQEVIKLKEQRATEYREELNKLANISNSLANKQTEIKANSNKIANTDSNKFSNNSEQLTDKFCRKMAEMDIIDSSCAEWRKNQ